MSTEHGNNLMTSNDNPANDNLIAIKQFAQLVDPFNWQKKYNTLRKQVQRGKYKSYTIIKGEGYINKNDQAIPVAVQIKLKETNNNTAIEQLNNHSILQSSNPSILQSNELSKKQHEFAIAAARLINLYIEHYNQPNYKGNKCFAQEKFIKAYNDNAFPELFAIIGKRDVQTIRRWKKDYITSGRDYRVLAPQHKTNKPSSVTPEQAQVIITLLLKPSKPLDSEVVREAMNIFEAKRFPHIRSPKTYRRFINDWKKEHYADYVFFREGEKGLDDLVLPYVERDWNLVEVGDIIIMDGHVNNYETINPFPNKEGIITGRPKRMMTIGAIDGRSQYLCGYEICPTENVQGIAVTIFRAILNLGKVPRVIYFDNGKAFGAKYFHGDEFENLIPLFKRLHIKVMFAKAYHGQSKPIECFWHWMAELERLVPTYCGTSIELQPPRMNRGEFIHRKLYEKAMQNTTVDIWASHRAMAWWLDNYHSRVKVDGHLKGLTPAEVFNAGKGPGVNRKELTFLMMDLTVTKLYQKGIKMFGKWYWHDLLFGKLIDSSDEVHVKYDLFQKDSIFVVDRQGNIVCEAFAVSKCHPAAKLLGTPQDVEELKNQLATKERLKSSVVGEARQFLQEEIYPFVQKQLKDANILQLPENTPSPYQGEGRGEVETGKPEGDKKRKRKSITDSWGMPNFNKERKIKTA